MKVEHARDSVLTLLELVKGTVLYIGNQTTYILDEFKHNGYTVNYASQTVKYNDNILIFGTIRSEQDVCKYMGLEVDYLYLPSIMDSELSGWMITKLRGNDNCLFMYDC